MTKKNTRKNYSVGKGMSVYRRDDRHGEYWGYLRINNKTYRKSLKTKSKTEGETLLFEWKTELLTDPKSEVSEYPTSFKYYSDNLIKKQQTYPETPSGISTWKTTEKLLNRKQGLLEFFGTRDIRSITKQSIENFVEQLPLNGRQLTTNTKRKHMNVLRQVIGMSDHTVEIPRVMTCPLKTDPLFKLGINLNWTDQGGHPCQENTTQLKKSLSSFV